MTRPTVFRLAAVSAALGGLALIVGWTLNIERDSVPGATTALVGYVLAIFAFIGIYAAQFQRMHLTGLVGFVLTITANVLFIPWLVLDLARLSGGASAIDWRAVERTGATSAVAITGAVAFMAGFLLFGFATWRARLFSRWPPGILILAAVMPLVHPWIGVGKLLARVGGAALVAFGWNLWLIATRDDPPRRRDPALEAPSVE